MTGATNAAGRVLVVDADPRVVSEWTRMLRPRHQVHTASSVAEALQAIRQHDFDVIVVAVMLGAEPGEELIRLLQPRATAVGTRIIFMAGTGDSATASGIRARWPNPVLETPHGGAGLLDVVNAALRTPRVTHLPDALAQHVSADAVQAEQHPAAVLDKDARIVFVNEAWDRFALDNDGRCATSRYIIGSRWIDHIDGDEPRRQYARLLDQLLAPADHVLQHLCECNTPETYRLTAARFQPLCRSQRVDGALIVYTLIREGPIAERYAPRPPSDARYRERSGMMVQCSGCRRVRAIGTEPPRWDFVPPYLHAGIAGASHSLCATCLDLLYGPPTPETRHSRVAAGTRRP